MAGKPERERLPDIRFAELAEALLARAEELVPQWLPGGSRAGPEYRCGSLSGGKGTSCSVNLVTGRWADFASDEQGGDLTGLYGAIHGLSPGKAAKAVALDTGLEDVAGIVKGEGGATRPPPPPRPPAPPPKPAPEREGWRALRPVPINAMQPTFRHGYRPDETRTHTTAYRVGKDLHGYVVRFRTSDDDKEDIPYTWCVSPKDGGARWHWKSWEVPRPLFLPTERLPEGRTVILVEGELKAIVLQQLLDAGAPDVYCVASWPGGCKAWDKAEWAWLAGCTVLLWPDCDSKHVALTAKEREPIKNDKDAQRALLLTKPLLPADKQPGLLAMTRIGALLDREHLCDVSMLRIPDMGAVPDGWDCKDAITVDGWDFERVQAFLATAFKFIPAPDAAQNARDAKAAADAKKIDGPAGAGGGDGADGGGGDDDDQDDDDKPMPWWLKPYWNADKARWTVSRKLVIKALTHDEKLQGVLGLNELSNNIEARKRFPWPQSRIGPITGTVDLMLGDYLTHTYGLPSIPRVALMEAIETVAQKHPWHPVRDYLGGLKPDGKSRIDKWLIYVLGETPESLGPSVAEYLKLVGRYWLLGMVNRVMNPGCKFDYCPVLEGPGGLGKSTLVEALASTPFYSDTHFDVGRGKEGQEQVQGLWLYEIAELANFGKAEIGLIKAFITGKVDRYRPSYGRTVESYARQCVLAGTTNERTYLRDRTGNRRFWPVPVRHRINIAWLLKMRDLLFAEAYALYLEAERYTPTHQDEERLFVPMQDSRLVDTAVLSELTHVLTRPPVATGIGAVVNELTAFATLSQLVVALGVDAAKSNAGLESQIRSWMDHEGWQRVKRQIQGVRAWGYERPKDWPPLLTLDEPEAGADNPPPATTQEPDDTPF